MRWLLLGLLFGGAALAETPAPAPTAPADAPSSEECRDESRAPPQRPTEPYSGTATEGARRQAGRRPAEPLLAEVLVELPSYIKVKDRKWLSAHLRFPFETSWSVYDMEVKTKSVTYRSAAALIRKADYLVLPLESQALLAKVVSGEIVGPRAGEAVCDKGEVEPNLEAGPPLVQVDGDTATLTLLQSACDPEEHYAVFRFVKEGEIWRLVQKSIVRKL